MLLKCWVFYMSLRSFVRELKLQDNKYVDLDMNRLFLFCFSSSSVSYVARIVHFLNAPLVFSNVYLLWGLQNILSVRCVKNKAGHFARQLQKTMKGLGTDDDTLVRIVVTRCEIDMVQIKEEFQTLTGQSLEQFIAVSIFPKVACLYLDGWRALEK